MIEICILKFKTVDNNILPYKLLGKEANLGFVCYGHNHMVTRGVLDTQTFFECAIHFPVQKMLILIQITFYIWGNIKVLKKKNHHCLCIGFGFENWDFRGFSQ